MLGLDGMVGGFWVIFICILYIHMFEFFCWIHLLVLRLIIVWTIVDFVILQTDYF